MPAIPLDTAGAVDIPPIGDIIVGGRTRPAGGFITAEGGIIAGIGTPQATPGRIFLSWVEAPRWVRRFPARERNWFSGLRIPESWDTLAT